MHRHEWRSRFRHQWLEYEYSPCERPGWGARWRHLVRETDRACVRIAKRRMCSANGSGADQAIMGRPDSVNDGQTVRLGRFAKINLVRGA